LTNIAVGTASFGLGLNPATNKIYVGGFSTGVGPGTITVINGADNTTTQATIDAAFGNESFLREFVPNTTTNKIYFRTNGPLGTNAVTAGVLDGATNVATPLSTSFGAAVIIRVNSTLNRGYVGNTAGQL